MHRKNSFFGGSVKHVLIANLQVVKAQIDRVVKVVLFAKDFIASGAGTDPHAAIAWAGVCLVLPLFLNSTTQEKALYEGFDYITTLIVRFTLIERLYSEQSSRSGPADKSHTDVHYSFEMEVSLYEGYRALISYSSRVLVVVLKSTDGPSTAISTRTALVSSCNR